MKRLFERIIQQLKDGNNEIVLKLQEIWDILVQSSNFAFVLVFFMI